MNNCNAIAVPKYDERSASNNLLHHTPFYLVVLCNWILQNKSFQSMLSTSARYNVTDIYLRTFQYHFHLKSLHNYHNSCYAYGQYNEYTKNLHTKEITCCNKVTLQLIYCLIIFIYFSSVWWTRNACSVSDHLCLIHSFSIGLLLINCEKVTIHV